MHEAARKGDTEPVKALVAAGSDVYCQENAGGGSGCFAWLGARVSSTLGRDGRSDQVTWRSLVHR